MKSLLINNIKFSVESYSENILRLLPVKVSQHASLPLLAEKILQKGLPSIENIIATKTEILLFTTVNSSQLRKEFKSFSFDFAKSSNQFSLPICFSKGEDWNNIEKLSGMKKTKLIDEILTSTLSLCMYGFLPGFMYLEGIPKSLQLPRKSEPAKKVRSGSFALGGPYAGIYNIDSPGGWHVIGNSPINLFNCSSILDPFINIGDTFTIKKISVSEWKVLNEDPPHIKDYH